MKWSSKSYKRSKKYYKKTIYGKKCLNKYKKKIQKRFVTGGIRTLNPLFQSQESYPLDQGALDTRRATNSKYKLLVQSLMIIIIRFT